MQEQPKRSRLPAFGGDTPAKKREHVADDPLEDFANFAKELVTGPIEIGRLAWRYATDPAQYVKDVKLLGDPGMAAETGGQLWGALTENWKDDEGNVNVWEAITRRPAHSINDILTLALGVGLAGKGAGIASRSARLTSASDSLINAATKLDPLVLSVKGAGAIVKASPAAGAVRKLADWAGVGKHTKAILSAIANEENAEAIAAAEDQLKLAGRGLLPEDVASLNRAVRRGAPEDVAALTPAAKAWYDDFSRTVAGEEGYLTERGFGLTDQRKMKANAIAASLQHFGDSSNAHVAEALAKIKAGEWKPTYASLFEPEVGGSKGLIDLMTEQYQKSKRYGRLESRAGTGTYETDIVKVAHRQVEMFHNFKAKIRAMDRVVATLAESGEAIPLAKLKDLPDGYAIVDTLVLKKYFEVKNRAGALLVDNLMKGQTPEEAMRAAYAAIMNDNGLRSKISNAGQVAVPRHVARLLDLQFGAPSGLGIVYDRLLSYWKSAAVLFRPSSWIGAAIGNAFLALIHGVSPKDVKMARRLKGTLPPEIRTRLQTVTDSAGTNAYERVANTLGEYYSALDNAIIRGPVFAKEVEAMRLRLRETGGAMFIALDTLNDPEKWAQLVAAGPETLSKAQRELLTIEERIAGRIPEVGRANREIGRMSRQVAELETAIAIMGDVPNPSGTGSLRADRVEGNLADEMDAAFADMDRAMAARQAGSSKRELQERLDGTRASLSAAYNKRRDLEATLVDDLAWAGKIKQTVPELERVSRWADEAIEAGNRLSGDYARLHPIERRFFRRAVPFWTYMKTMTKLVVTLPFLYPKRLFFWNHFSQMANDLMDDPDTPDYLDNHVPIGIAADGDFLFVKLTPFMPWSGVKTADVGGKGIPSLFDVASANPIVKVGFDLYGASPQWSKKPWSPGMNATRLDSGEVFELAEGGRIKRTMPAPSLWRSLWYLFPQSQLIETLTVPYVMTDQGWLGHWDPIRKPNGDIMFPKDIMERLSSFVGVPTMKRDVKEMQQRQKAKEIRVAKEFAHDIRRQPPEKREAMMAVLKTWIDERRRRGE